MSRRALSGSRVHTPVVVQVRGIVFRDCPPWVPAAVLAAVDAKLVPAPVEITWHPRPLKTLLGRCWPREGRIDVHPHSGEQWRVEEDLDVDASGELRIGRSRVARIAGQDDAELEDTLAHELAHLVHARHGAPHRALTERVAAVIRQSR